MGLFKKDEDPEVKTLQAQVSALKDEIEDQKSLGNSIYNSFEQIFSDDGSGHFSRQSKISINVDDMRKLYKDDNWTYTLVNLYAGAISSVPLRVAQFDTDGNAEFIEGHPAVELLEYPNEDNNYEQFMSSFVCELMTTGTSTAYYLRQNDEIILLDQTRLKPKIDDFNRVISWEYEKQDNGIMVLPKEDVIKAKLPSLGNELSGMSPVVAARYNLVLNMYMQEFELGFYKKGARPGIVIKSKKKMDTKQLVQTMAAFEQAYTGRNNHFKTMILPDGVEAEVFQFDHTTMEFIQQKQDNRDEILGAFKIPKSIVFGQSVNHATAKQEEKSFWQKSIIPVLGYIEAAFNRTDIIKENNVMFKFDLSQVMAFQDDLNELANRSATEVQFFTINEVRQRNYGAEPLPDGDVLANPVLSPPAASGFTALSEEESETKDAKVSEGYFPKEAVEEMEKQASADYRILENQNETRRRQDLDAFYSEVEDELRNILNDPSVIKRELGSSINEKARRIKVNDRKAERLAKRIMRDLEKRVEDPEDRTSLIQAYEDELNKHMEEIFQTRFDQATSRVALGSSFQPRDEAVQEVRENGRKLTAEHWKTTKDQIFEIVRQGFRDVDTPFEISQQITDKLGEYFTKRKHSQTIARTEILSAMSQGEIAGFEAVKEQFPDASLIWITAQDDRVRPSHAQANNTGRGTDGKFVNGLRFPRDPNGGAGDVINCRCSTIIDIPRGG